MIFFKKEFMKYSAWFFLMGFFLSIFSFQFAFAQEARPDCGAISEELRKARELLREAINNDDFFKLKDLKKEVQTLTQKLKVCLSGKMDDSGVDIVPSDTSLADLCKGGCKVKYKNEKEEKDKNKNVEQVCTVDENGEETSCILIYPGDEVTIKEEKGESYITITNAKNGKVFGPYKIIKEKPCIVSPDCDKAIKAANEAIAKYNADKYNGKNYVKGIFQIPAIAKNGSNIVEVNKKFQDINKNRDVVFELINKINALPEPPQRPLLSYYSLVWELKILTADVEKDGEKYLYPDPGKFNIGDLLKSVQACLKKQKDDCSFTPFKENDQFFCDTYEKQKNELEGKAAACSVSDKKAKIEYELMRLKEENDKKCGSKVTVAVKLPGPIKLVACLKPATQPNNNLLKPDDPRKGMSFEIDNNQFEELKASGKPFRLQLSTSWCVPCQEAKPHSYKNYSKFQKDGSVIPVFYYDVDKYPHPELQPWRVSEFRNFN